MGRHKIAFLRLFKEICLETNDTLLSKMAKLWYTQLGPSQIRSNPNVCGFNLDALCCRIQLFLLQVSRGPVVGAPLPPPSPRLLPRQSRRFRPIRPPKLGNDSAYPSSVTTDPSPPRVRRFRTKISDPYFTLRPKGLFCISYNPLLS
jgi:hypothetical protein